MRLQAAQNQLTSFEVPVGGRGTRQTLRLMSKLVREYRASGPIRDTAKNLVEHLPSQAAHDEVRALFHFVRDEIRYLGDVNEVETIQAPDVTLASGQGDCDDKATLLASLLQSIGFKTQFVAVGFSEPGVFEHVFLRALLGNHMVSLDPTVEGGACSPNYTGEPCPGEMGWEPPDQIAVMVENT
jgi:hypothetical protein